MSGARILAGSAFNVLGNSATILTSPNSDADFPIARIADYRPDTEARFTAGANRSFTVDLGAAYAETELIDFVSIHGHNLDKGISLQVESDDTAGLPAASIRATFAAPIAQTDYRLFDYGGIGMAVERYWRFTFFGTNSVPIQVGEIVLGISKVPSVSPSGSWRVRFSERNIARQSLGGDSYDITRAVAPMRVWEGRFGLRSRAALAEFRDQYLLPSVGGKYPLVFVPLDDEDFVFFAKLAASWEIPQVRRDHTDMQMVLIEEPLIYGYTP